ncbi:MAG: BMP family ABC transporter substrate-binding protein [Treponema sp.]|nr:BMP family ABC transporter substrate-binding protein [Treponema sp.]
MNKNHRRNTHNQIYILGFLVGALILSGCSKTPEPQDWEPGRPFPRERVVIGVIHPNEIHSDSLFDQAQFQGTLVMQERLGLEDHQIIRKTNVFTQDQAATEGALRDCIAEGANLIIAMSFEYMDVIERLAREFPSVVFAHATGNRFNERNFANYSIRLYQGRYLAGILAGLRTETNLIGYVAARGRDNSEVTGGINAFAMGAASVNPDARVLVSVTHSWYDPMGETTAANALIAAGCDVITSHANTPSAQIAASRAGVWAIGYNADMKDAAPDAVIASVVLYWGALYTQFVQSVIEGTFVPQTHYFGLHEGAIDLTELNPLLAPPGAEEAIGEARQRIRQGGFNVFDGVMETNEGGTVGNPGGTLSDREILREMNWYYRNVEQLP